MPDPVGTPVEELRVGGHQLLLELAAGGMATVHVARKVGAAGFEKLVVVKRVHAAFARNREFADMFRDEARICATIRHPNVVSTLDVVEEMGELFLVIEYVESMSLSSLLAAVEERGERLPPAVVVRIVADALTGLHAAHEATDLRGNRLEIIHRDVSPQNVIVGLDGTSRLIDFGIAKAASRISVTSSGVLKGKLRYMSPEQVKRKPIDRRADVFAAGVVLFEALTGRRLFAGDDEGDVLLGILVTEVPAPSSLFSDLPLPALDAVVAKALAQDREERYQTAAEFAEALEAALVPATARDVGRAIEAYGGAVLAERRAKLRAAMDRATEEVTPAGEASRHSVRATVRSDPRGFRAAGVALRVLLALSAVAAVAFGAVSVERSRASSSPAASVSAATSAPSVASALAAPITTPSSSAVAPSPSSSASAIAPHVSKPSHAPQGQALHRRNPYGAP
jgi:hypothetical protein